MNRLFLTNKKRSMRSVNVGFNKLVESNFKYTYISEKPFEYLESNLYLQLNNLEKRKVSNPAKNSHNSKTRHVNEVLYNT